LKVKKLILKNSLKKKEFKEKRSTLLGNFNKNSLDLKKKEKKSGIDFKESRS
jgi:hypothetical protein